MKKDQLLPRERINVRAISHALKKYDRCPIDICVVIPLGRRLLRHLSDNPRDRQH